MKTNEHYFYSEIANWSFEDFDYISEQLQIGFMKMK